MQHNEGKGRRTYVNYIQSDANDLLNSKSSLCSLNVSDIWRSGSMEDESHSKPNTSTSTSLHRHMDSHHIQVNTQEQTTHLGPLCAWLSDVLPQWQQVFFVLLHFPLSYVTWTFTHTHAHTQTDTRTHPHTHNHTDVWTTTAASDLGLFSICWHFDWIGKWAPLKNTYHPWHVSFRSLEAGVQLQDWV